MRYNRNKSESTRLRRAAEGKEGPKMGTVPSKTELFQQGYNCCQIINCYLADVCGFDAAAVKDSFDLMCDTCGGTCGTLRGGAYCLRMYAKNKGYEREQANEMVGALFDAWLRTNYGVTRDQLPKVRQLISELCRNGPIQEEESILVSMLYWKADKSV